MKIVVLAALFVAVASRPDSSTSLEQNQPQWPWQVGKQYHYDVESHTLARLSEGPSTGSAFKAHFIVRVKAPGQLQAKLKSPLHAQVHQYLLPNGSLPTDLQYKTVSNIDQPFEITLHGGRVISISVPSSLSLAHENLIKGLLSALQVDLQHRRSTDRHHNYDKETHQGQFSKLETDVTGDCETLYTVSAAAAEWRRELPNFLSVEDPIEVTKSKNYGRCHHRVAYHFGIPAAAEWQGQARKNDKEQLLERSTFSRVLVGKQGPIYKTEASSHVYVSPLKYGKQKAQVSSRVTLNLVSMEEVRDPEWQLPENQRKIKSLLYALSTKKRSEPGAPGSPVEMPMPVNTPFNNRVRRSNRMPKSISHTNDRHSREYSENSGSSDAASHINDDVPSMSEPAYTALYMQNEHKDDKKQNLMNSQKLAQEIAQLLQNPNNMPKSDVLAKFNILVRLISAMSYEQLQQTSRSIETAKSSNDIVKSNIWNVYRDAVAQAGTFPAFEQIKNWIQSKKIQGEEAAEVVASLPTTLRYPTKKLMIEFFNLALSDDVRQQKYLNDTILIAATRFINMGQVNNHTAHTYYPSQMYGRLADKRDRFVPDEVIPRLKHELQQAIEQGDSHIAQVYIKALGKLGHRDILYVYAPYLEGKIPVSTYLRTYMVSNLLQLVHEDDHYAQSALFSILKNTAEHYEVRVAAIKTIFMGHPTVSMMQEMAEITWNDPSIHVRATLKSAIDSAAKLTHPRYLDLARSAQKVQHRLTREKFGTQHSHHAFIDSYEYEQQRGVLGMLSYTSSEDSLFPKSFWASLESNVWSSVNGIGVSFSSVRQFIDYFRQRMDNSNMPSANTESNFKYSADVISEMLNLKRNPENALEAAFYFKLMNQDRLLTLGENEMKQLPETMQLYLHKLAEGIEYDYTKIFNQEQMTIMFPTATGMPFIYKYKVPTLVRIQGKAKGQINIPSNENKNYSLNLDKEIQLTFARNIVGKVGFLDTLTNEYSSAGVDSKLQLNIPLKAHFEIKSGETKIKLQQLRPDQDTTIVHYSVWPYTASQNKDSLIPVALDPTTKTIARENKVSSIDYRMGQDTGLQFQLQGYSYSTDFQNLGSLYSSRGDLLSNILHLLRQKDLAQTHYNFRFLGKQSQNKEVTFNVVYDKLYNQQQDGETPQAASELSETTPNSENRRQELVKRVVTGIKTAQAIVVDLSVIFNGAQKHEYVFTGAVGQSPIDTKIQFAFFAGRNSAKLGNNQVNAVASMKKTESLTFNVLETLNKELKGNYHMDVKFGQNGHINIQAHAERSHKRTEELKNDPWTKQCQGDMSHNNHFLTSCARMLIVANAPDYFKASVSYKDVSPMFKNMTYQLYRLSRHYGFWYSSENPLKSTADGKLEIEARNSYVDNTFSLTLNSRVGDLRMENVPIPRVFIPALSFYTPMKQYEQILNHYTRYQYEPFCTVDSSAIRTFSNRTFNYTLTTPWHVVYHDDAKYAGKYGQSDDQLVILARKLNTNQQNVYISYKSNFGKTFEMELQPGNEANKIDVKVESNANKISQGALNLYWDDEEHTPLLKYHISSDDVLMLDIHQNRLRALYDGQRLVVMARDNRNNTRGLCGRMSGDSRDDYLTPYGIVDTPEMYGAAFALTKDMPHPETQQLQSSAKQNAYEPKLYHTTILRSDNEWRHEQQYSASVSSSSESASGEHWESQNVYRTKSYMKQRGPCQLHLQVQYYENHGEICVTTTPLESCQSHCSGEGYKVQAANVVCRPKLDQQFQSHKKQIRQGGNPQVDGVPQIKQFRVPSSCKA